MTTVEELIDFLTQFPPSTLVVYELYSEVTDLDLERIRFVTAEEKALYKHHNMPDWYIVSRGWNPKPDNVEYVTALILPGN